MRIKHFIPVAVAVIFLYFLFKYGVFWKLKEIFSALRPEYLILSLLFYTSTYIFRALRFSVMFPSIPVSELSAVMGVHTFFNNLLPFRSGEASFPIILKKLFGVDAAISSVALLLVRVLDVLSLSLLFSISAFVVATQKTELLWIPLLISVALLGALFVGAKLLKKLKDKFSVVGMVFSFLQGFVSPSNLLRLSAFSLLTWLFKFISFFFILKAGGVELSFFQTTFASTFGELTSILPVHSIGGFGTYEAGLTGGFALLGIKTDRALTVAFYFHLLLLLMSAVLAALGWSFLSFRLKKRQGA
ncbi:lysylphosphatidylglycerol synthase transmembrane domain-containing protein [Phorcysia thermohydrogeniphila]|uniref:Lysylphosphatidylglycerol synthase-like protein n=1 Tax=Phorcysia thermohydrogeniphila TaxID=936138 RepID=A0A4R1GD85_9BACT|nr:lysylphosphatidylglycerol synthase transmembrane domain-containing protein [Phorcysia thermohydrogeniphila]TCK04525.1 hypothetical protein CLV27_0957 [Phorcysia thermohydrogeniphila]